jgi:anti-sigma-K factor RskA
MMRDLDCARVRELAPEYVLGTLDAAVVAAVRDHLETCPEAHEELRELGGSLASVARSLEPVAPRDELRSRLLAEARARRPVSLVANQPQAAEPSGRAQPARSWLERLTSPRLAWSLAAAAAAVAVLAVATGLTLRSQLDEANRTAATLRTIATEAARPGARIARLQGTGQAAGIAGLAVVGRDGGALVLEGLPPAPADAYYEAWYLSGGVARSAGHVDRAPDGTGLVAALTDQGPIDQMAVTLEPVGGGSGPDGPIYASGAVTTNPG